MICFFFRKIILKVLGVLFVFLSYSLNILSCCADDTGSSQPPPLKVALALGGGGTRGIAHIGVLRVLSKEGIPIDAIAGTSMGSLIGGLYCAGLTPDQIEAIFHKRAIIHAFDTVPIPVRIALIPILILPRLFGHHTYEGLYHGNKFAKYISHLVPEDKRHIENLQPKFWAIGSNLLDGEAHAIKKGNIGKAIQASSAIPILRRPVEIAEMLFVDGGILENVPTEHARQMGCDYVIAVNVDEQVIPVECKIFRALGSVSNRVINMNLAKIDERQLALADAVIQPDLRGIRLLSLKEKDAIKAIAAGEQAATAAIPYLKQQLAELRIKKEFQQAQIKITEPAD